MLFFGDAIAISLTLSSSRTFFRMEKKRNREITVIYNIIKDNMVKKRQVLITHWLSREYG